MGPATSSPRRRVWLERLSRRVGDAHGDERVAQLGHELLKVQAHAGPYVGLDEEELHAEAERVLAELGERVGVGPPPD